MFSSEFLAPPVEFSGLHLYCPMMMSIKELGLSCLDILKYLDVLFRVGSDTAVMHLDEAVKLHLDYHFL